MHPEETAKVKATHFCSNCNEEINPEDQFCGSCGSKVEQAEPAVDAPPSGCPNCGEPLSGGDQFCGGCGHQSSSASIAEGTPAPEQTVLTEPKSSRKGLVAIVVIGLILAGIYIFYQNFVPQNSQQPASQSNLLVPTDADILDLESLMIKAETEWLEAKSAGNKQLAAKKGQEYAHYKTGLSHAEKMKIAYEDMVEAQKAGDSAAAASNAHSFRHYRGQLVIMRKSAKQLPPYLDQKIQEWTEN